jgi:hypothetical protein
MEVVVMVGVGWVVAGLAVGERVVAGLEEEAMVVGVMVVAGLEEEAMVVGVMVVVG